MTKLHKAKILESQGIEWKINDRGVMLALVKMSLSNGDDCSEWLEARDVIEDLKEQPAGNA